LAAPAHATFPGANGKIAFWSDRDGTDQVYTMNSDGTGVVKLTSTPGKNFFPTWSPDGTKIAFVSTRDDPTPTGCTTCNQEIYVMNTDGTNQLRITHDPWYDQAVRWKPAPK
jgi:TolB protein